MAVPHYMLARLLRGSRPCLQSFVVDICSRTVSLTGMSRQEYGWGRGGRDRGPRRGGRGGRGGFGGPPRGLSGKEIGMYYKNKSLAHRKEREKNEVRYLLWQCVCRCKGMFTATSLRQ